MLRVICDERGSFAEPDVASVFPYYSESFLDPNGKAVLVTSSWTTPLHVVRETAAGLEVVIAAPEVHLASP